MPTKTREHRSPRVFLFALLRASTTEPFSTVAAASSETSLIRDPRDDGGESQSRNLRAFPRPDEKHEIPLRTYTLRLVERFRWRTRPRMAGLAAKSFLVALGTRSGDTSPVRAEYIETVVG